MTQHDELKRKAAEAALGYVKDGMVIGLGTGTTAAFLVRALAERLRSGLCIVGAVPTSQATAQLASGLGIPLVSLEEHPELDLAIDGADEIDPQFHIIKGGGGALLREKVVASAAKRFIVICDASKLVLRLGDHFRLPVEVVPFARTHVSRHLEALGADVQLRMHEKKIFITDNQNNILDSYFPGGIANPATLQAQLNEIPGMVEHGIFLRDLVDEIIVAGVGGVQHLVP